MVNKKTNNMKPAKKSIYNWGEVSRTLATSRSAITESGRGHKKHAKAIKNLEHFELEWRKLFDKQT